MLMTFILENFTPIIDVLVQEIDLVGSAVYGVVWRYCQMERGLCFASIETLAHKIGVNRRTIERHLKRLCELGYLEDTTPDLQGAPHVYAVTNKIEYIQTAKFQVHSEPTTESRTPPTTESRRGYDRKSHKETIEETKNSVSASPSRATAKKPKNPQPAAVKMFRSKAHRFPSKCWWKEVDAVVGDDPADLERWGEVVFNWCGLGWNPTNVKGMLDCFKQNETLGDYANNGRPNGKANSGGRISGNGAAVEGRVDPGHFATGLGPVITEEMLRANREGRLDDLERLIAGSGDDGQADGSGLPAV